MVARSKGLMLLPQKSYLQSLYESFSHSEDSGHQIVTLMLGNNPVTGSPGIQGLKNVGICGNALKLTKSYFSNRTQRVQIDDVLSDFANIICGVPQGSVLGPLQFCLYLLPMSAILKYHKIGYHVYADDIQLYISFKCKQPLEEISKVNSCVSDIRRWMITNKLKINDSKTEFIMFRSPRLRCDLSGLSVNVGESPITQSLKVRDIRSISLL